VRRVVRDEERDRVGLREQPLVVEPVREVLDRLGAERRVDAHDHRGLAPVVLQRLDDAREAAAGAAALARGVPRVVELGRAIEHDLDGAHAQPARAPQRVRRPAHPGAQRDRLERLPPAGALTVHLRQERLERARERERIPAVEAGPELPHVG